LPLLIFLHGASGVVDDIQQAKVNDRPAEIWKGIQNFNKGPCIVIAPQCLKKSKSGERGLAPGRPQPPSSGYQGDIAGG
jgi:predicted peptidase